MKNFPLRWALALAVSMWMTLSASAQTKIGLVNLQKVYDGYYKTKQAAENLREDAAEKDKSYKAMATNLVNGNAEWKALTLKANDQAVAAEEREKARLEAEKKMAQLKDYERTVKEFVQNSETQIKEKIARIREKLLKELYEAVSAKARSLGYTLIFDLAAQTANGTPAILFSSGENDITEIISAQVNASAPIEIPEKKTAPEKKK